ncbi:MAG TPA: FkbM family methyltransferase [Methylomicrobium sp.]|nr:FkbM family methyltransferase [Methylomicrobium sp.]
MNNVFAPHLPEHCKEKYFRKSGYQGLVVGVAKCYTRKKRVAIDIGAHVGLWTMQLLDEYMGFGHVYAFEPDPLNCECFKKNVTEHATLFEIALGSCVGRASLLRFDGNSGATECHIDPNGEINVSVLDNFITKIPDVDLIKIDAQGMDFDVLLGGVHMIMMHRPLIVIECVMNDTFDRRVPKFLECLDYFEIAHIDKDFVFKAKKR